MCKSLLITALFLDFRFSDWILEISSSQSLEIFKQNFSLAIRDLASIRIWNSLPEAYSATVSISVSGAYRGGVSEVSGNPIIKILDTPLQFRFKLESSHHY